MIQVALQLLTRVRQLGLPLLVLALLALEFGELLGRLAQPLGFGNAAAEERTNRSCPAMQTTSAATAAATAIARRVAADMGGLGSVTSGAARFPSASASAQAVRNCRPASASSRLRRFSTGSSSRATPLEPWSDSVAATAGRDVRHRSTLASQWPGLGSLLRTATVECRPVPPSTQITAPGQSSTRCQASCLSGGRHNGRGRPPGCDIPDSRPPDCRTISSICWS